MDDSASRASQISLAAKEQAQTTRAMAEAMQSLASISTESAAGARETAKSVAHLVRLSEALDLSVTRFRLD